MAGHMAGQQTGKEGAGVPAVQDAMTPQELEGRCQHLASHGNGAQALQLALQMAQSSQDVSILLVAGLFVARNTARQEIAAAIFRKALLLMPSGSPTLRSLRGELEIFLADSLMAAGQNEEAMALFMEVARQHPEHRVMVGEHLSMSLLEAGHADRAEQVLLAWLQDGSPSVSLYNNMGCALGRLNRSGEALAYYRKGMALASRHEAVSFGYAISLLKAGEYEEGFERYVRRLPRIPSLACWFWQDLPRLQKGTPLQGKRLLFYQEQGLGDTIQFIRFLPAILNQAEMVTLAVLPSLARLLRESYPMVQVRLIGDLLEHPEQVADYDMSCPIPDLPWLYGLRTLDDIPPFHPYLRVPARRREGFARLVAAAVPPQKTGDGKSPARRRLRVGIVWAGDARSSAQDVAADRRRSSSLEEMMAALAPVEADFFSLQHGQRRDELAAPMAQPVHDLMGDVQDMADTAALMDSLDLVISVDTSPLHLAAALGLETWLISRWDACWRWGDEGERSPWYPTLRIFRTHELSLWPALEAAGACLRQRVAGGG